MTNTYWSTTTNSTGDYWVTMDYKDGSYYNQYPGSSVTISTPWISVGDPEVENLKAKLKELEERLNKPSRGVDMKAIWEVILCYGEDRKSPVIVHAPQVYVIADNEEDAKLKSGIYNQVLTNWDEDYITIIVRKIGDVKIKERAKEVKQV